MSGSDNTVAMKIARAYDRLIVAILRKSPEWIVNYLFAEVQGWAAPKLLDLNEIRRETENFVLIWQSGRAIAVPKNSHFAKAIIYGKKEEKKEG